MWSKDPDKINGLKISCRHPPMGKYWTYLKKKSAVFVILRYFQAILSWFIFLLVYSNLEGGLPKMNWSWRWSWTQMMIPSFSFSPSLTVSTQYMSATHFPAPITEHEDDYESRRCIAIYFLLSPYLYTFMEPRHRFQRNDSASLYSLASPYDKWAWRTGPPGWESIPGLLKRFTNTGSDIWRGNQHKHRHQRLEWKPGQWREEGSMLGLNS